jgi:hypothetical protein
MKKVGKYVTTNTNNVLPVRYEPGFVAPDRIIPNGTDYTKYHPDYSTEDMQGREFERYILDVEAELYGF